MYIYTSPFIILFLSPQLLLQYVMQGFETRNTVQKCIEHVDNIYIKFGYKLYRQIIGISMGTNFAPPVADLFLFSYQRDFMLSFSDVNQSEVIE